jgi:DNA-binding transcriptional MocR family regulator
MDGPVLEAASQYGPSDMHPSLAGPLRTWHEAKDGVVLSDGSLAALNGGQEGLFIMAYLFLTDDDGVALSEPTYPGALAAFRTFTSRFLSVPLDGEGMNTKALEDSLDALARRGRKLPKFVYTIPSGHNPGGVSLSPERRRHLMAVARRFDLFVLEDDPYQLIRLEESSPAPPTLQSLDEDGRVVRLDSFSKILAPGFRIGYASGTPEIIRLFVLFKQAANIHTSSFAQALLARCLEEMQPQGFLERIGENCRFYCRNRDAMIEAAQEFLPSGIDYNIPREGFFVWFRMPDECSAAEMIQRDCLDLKVVLVPGKGFSATGGLDHCMRASFATASTKDIREGMRRFSAMIRREYEHRGI